MKLFPSKDRARITEIFSSLQGEGPRMGERQLFIRFESCHLACEYCDERMKRGRELPLAEVLRAVDALEKMSGPHAHVSLTGGEPLLYTAFLKPLCRELQKRKYRTLLETNGVLGGELKKVLGFCHLIAMDMKLASVTGGKSLLNEHAEFLKVAVKKETYVKIAVSPKIDRAEYGAHIRMVASLAPQTPVFLQPVSERGEGIPAPKLLKLLEQLQRIGRERLPDVRLGIQLHKVLKIR